MTDLRIEEQIREDAEALEQDWDANPRWHGIDIREARRADQVLSAPLAESGKIARSDELHSQISVTRARSLRPLWRPLVPETLMVPLLDWSGYTNWPRPIRSFRRDLADLLKNFAGRPTPLQFARRLTAHLGGPRRSI